MTTLETLSSENLWHIIQCLSPRAACTLTRVNVRLRFWVREWYTRTPGKMGVLASDLLQLPNLRQVSGTIVVGGFVDSTLRSKELTEALAERLSDQVQGDFRVMALRVPFFFSRYIVSRSLQYPSSSVSCTNCHDYPFSRLSWNPAKGSLKIVLIFPTSTEATLDIVKASPELKFLDEELSKLSPKIRSFTCFMAQTIGDGEKIGPIREQQHNLFPCLYNSPFPSLHTLTVDCVWSRPGLRIEALSEVRVIKVRTLLVRGKENRKWHPQAASNIYHSFNISFQGKPVGSDIEVLDMIIPEDSLLPMLAIFPKVRTFHVSYHAVTPDDWLPIEPLTGNQDDPEDVAGCLLLESLKQKFPGYSFIGYK